MRAEAGILIFICLLFLVGTVGAAVGIPDKVIVITDKPWIIANNIDQSTITVTVTNSTPGYVIDPKGVIVNFAVDPLYGTMSQAMVTTDSSGMASSTFKVKTKSGAARINATTALVFNSTIQNIDHNLAYYADFTHPLNGTVSSQVLFNVSITDQYQNPVDNRRGNHIISLHVTGPAPDDCGFAEAGFAHDISTTLDANGNTSVHVRLTQRIGDNNILMDGYESIPNQLEWITAEAKGVPASITQVVSPSGSPPTLPADNKSVFTIIYTLFDVYGNPTNGQYIWINTSVIGEEKMFASNSLGQVVYSYGPRSTIGDIFITATSVANSTVASSPQEVKFTNTGAQIISLTADPNVMPSHDVSSSTPVANIIATVADASGNAVAGETVTFSLGSETYEATYNVTAHPSLSSLGSVTDGYGQAIVQFTPGSFTTVGNPGFNATATGHCNVIATWNGTQKIVPLTWKNYPFLSVTTSTDPDTIGINQTVNVSIVFRGDGWAFTRPSDVVLVTDLSGTMSLNTKMNDTRNALKKFVGLSGGNLNIALASFSDSSSLYSNEAYQLWKIQNANNSATPFNPYGSTWDRTLENPSNWGQWGYSDAQIDQTFTTDSTTLNNTINTRYTSPKGGTNLEGGLSAANLAFNNNAASTNPKVIIMMTDGIADMASINSTYPLKAYEPSDLNKNLGYSSYSNIAKTSAINLASTLKSQNIKIYTIGFGSDADLLTLKSIASPGCDYNATDGTALSNVYSDIYSKISDPGVDTQMTLDFQNINVTQVSIPGAQVYNYVPSTKIGWQNGTVSYMDQTSDWAADHQLSFNIGTIKLKQQWNATFQLRVNQSGLVEVFGKNSMVTFNGGTQTLYLPQTFITVVPNLNALNITAKTIKLENLKVTDPGVINVLLPVTWNTTYTGNKTLTEMVYYQIDNGPWVLFDTKTHVYNPLTMEYTDFAQLDVTKLPPGSYLIKVVATASDAPDATITLGGPVNVGNRGRTYIKLQ